MTTNSPRIYVYKITFDEVDHYYYGSKKEDYYGQYYMGSPVTHKDFWEKYTPRKEYIEFFEYSDEGYAEARKFEDSLIAPVLNDEFCLNEHVGGFLSLESCRRGGKTSYKKGAGFHGRSLEKMNEDGKRGGKIGGKTAYEKGVGIHGRSLEKMSQDGKKAGKIGGLKGGKTTSSQKWQCTVTGYVSNAGGLTRYQKAKGIDTFNRIKVDDPRAWEITFEDNRVIVTYQTLKDWAKENGYSYRGLINVRVGKTKNHKYIIKIVPL